MFSKSTENINTKIIVSTELGKLTVHISDDEIHMSISDVYSTVNDLLNGMKNISDAFGIDIKSALSSSDIMSLHTDADIKSNIDGRLVEKSIVPKSIAPKSEIIKQNELNSKNDLHDGGVDDLDSFQETQKIIDKVNVTSPNGRNFQLPTQIKDSSGDTTITIDTKSAENFERINKNIENASYKDGYGAKFVPCKLCFENKTKQSTGYIRGKQCPKCGGSGEMLIS